MGFRATVGGEDPAHGHVPDIGGAFVFLSSPELKLP